MKRIIAVIMILIVAVSFCLLPASAAEVSISKSNVTAYETNTADSSWYWQLMTNDDKQQSTTKDTATADETEKTEFEKIMQILSIIGLIIWTVLFIVFWIWLVCFSRSFWS